MEWLGNRAMSKKCSGKRISRICNQFAYMQINQIETGKAENLMVYSCEKCLKHGYLYRLTKSGSVKSPMNPQQRAHGQHCRQSQLHSGKFIRKRAEEISVQGSVLRTNETVCQHTTPFLPKERDEAALSSVSWTVMCAEGVKPRMKEGVSL
ncbi:hypothetical protein SRHO_G00083530 [Serrasalmus rhombeus]